MKQTVERIGVLVLLMLAGSLAYTAWKLQVTFQSAGCRVCHRHVHAGSKAIALWNDKREAFCCPTCALTFGRQRGRVVKVVELTDFESGFKVAPEDAYVVQGSNINLCMQQRMLMDSQKQSSSIGFDRCSPGILVFSNRRSAEGFQREHGGKLLHFQALASE